MLQDDHDPDGKPVPRRANAGIPRGPPFDEAMERSDPRRNDTDAKAERPAGRPRERA